MKERPILFKGEMVRAILDGKKTQTRRVMKVQPSQEGMKPIRLVSSTAKEDRKNIDKLHWALVSDLDILVSDDEYFDCPYGRPGDQLWVRETWAKSNNCNDRTIFYKSTDGDLIQRALSYSERESRWRPSIHMFREYSRIDLLIKDVRVERLQDITNEDTLKEGIGHLFGYDESKGPPRDGRQRFYELWQSINGCDSWDANPWVWVVEFEKL